MTAPIAAPTSAPTSEPTSEPTSAGTRPAAALRAASALTDLLEHLSPRLEAVRIHHRGHGRLWPAWADELRARDVAVEVRVAEAGDLRWEPPSDDGAGRALDVYHDPFGPNTGGGALLDRLRDRVGPLVLVDYPHGLHDPELEQALEDRYLAALAVPWYSVEARGRAYATALRSSTTFAVAAGDVRLEARALGVRTDLGSYERDVPVVQLPLGEAWGVLDPAGTTGTIHVGSGGGRSARLPADGWSPVDAPSGARSPVELGIGTNGRAPWLPGTVLAEKARGRLHLGYGDSSLIGGTVVADHHVDVSLVDTSRVVLSHPRGLGRPFVVDDDGGDWGVLTEDPPEVVVAREDDAGGPVVLGATVVEATGTRSAGAADARAHVLGDPSRAGASSNVEALGTLGDPRLRDVLVIPAGTVPTTEVARFRTDGALGTGIAGEPRMHRVWSDLRGVLGPLPWDEVVVLEAALEWPRGLSFPGTVLLSDELGGVPGTLRWAYLLHELVHQWLGGLVRTDSARQAHAEAYADAVALAVLSRSSAASARALTRVHERYTRSGVPDLVERGEHVLALTRDVPAAEATVATVATAAEASWRSLRGSGARSVFGTGATPVSTEGEKC